MSRGLRIALIQLLSRESRSKNLQQAKVLVSKAADNGAQLVVLPELFTTELHPPIIYQNRERIPEGPTTQLMSSLAKQYCMHIVAGSIPEEIENYEKLYNTSSVFNPKGERIAQYRKMHMFDVDLGERLKIQESELSYSGNKLTTFDMDFGTIGIGICIDMRYPEISRLYKEKGCALLVFLGAFSAARTGPAHWEVLQRARAIDNQVYVATCAPARDDTAHYSSWGHSSVVDPWGTVISGAKNDEEIVYADLDMEYLKEVRRQLPLEEIRRKDLYNVVFKERQELNEKTAKVQAA